MTVWHVFKLLPNLSKLQYRICDLCPDLISQVDGL